MKRTTILLSALILSSSAAAADIRPVLPPVQHLDTEVVTNVAVSAQGSREYSFGLTFSGTASNNVEIAFGVFAALLTQAAFFRIIHAHRRMSSTREESA